jgi:hypothetical protein
VRKRMRRGPQHQRAATTLALFLLYSPKCLEGECSEVAGSVESALTSSEVYKGSAEGHHGSVEGESFQKECERR